MSGREERLYRLHEQANGRIRRPAVAGSFYPAPARSLRNQVEEFLRNVEGPALSRVRAIIAPHAGYVYSGQVAAHAYAALKGSWKRVVVISPSHQLTFDGISAYPGEAYQTPLGKMELDLEALARLEERLPSLRYLSEAHRDEHALEVQLPFLQIVLSEAKLIPLVMGSQDIATARMLGKALAEALPDALVVASSDLSHYKNDATARILDGVIAEYINSFDPVGLLDSVRNGKSAACGAGPMAAAMFFAHHRGATDGKVLEYATSARVTGDTDQVVGYLAAAFYSPESAATEKEKTMSKHNLTEQEQSILLDLARETLENHFNGVDLPTLTSPPLHLTEERGVFVTLKKRGYLRGCIGYIRGDGPLWEATREMTLQAALHDPRFSPVTADEAPNLQLEISVLSPIEPCPDPTLIEVGRHGLIIQHHGRSGLLLPQVPVEQGWNREEFLQGTCHKAGLPANAWQKGATILYFSAQVFSLRE